jgi:hypothetical protein
VLALGDFDYALEMEAIPIPGGERYCLNDSTWRIIPRQKVWFQPGPVLETAF